MSASRVTERIEPKLKMKWDEVLTSFAGGTLRILQTVSELHQILEQKCFSMFKLSYL